MRSFVPDDLFNIAWVGSCDLAADATRVAVVVGRLDRSDDQNRSIIWVVDLISGRQWPFTSGAGRDFAPRWSPDGRWLAFLREEPDERPQIAIMPSDGGEARTITELPFGTAQPVSPLSDLPGRTTLRDPQAARSGRRVRAIPRRKP